MTPATPMIPVTTTTLLEPSFLRPHRRHRAGERPAGADPAALGLLVAANRQMAGPSGRGDPRPLAGGADFRRRNCITPVSASRPKTLGEPQVQCPGGAALVRQGARRTAARRTPIARVGEVS